jgi:NitT/TauT family transport system substrate-binding protein
LQQINVYRGNMAKRAGWGDHNMGAWRLFFDKIYQLKQITKPVKAEDVCTNVLIAGANNFDHAKVKADADSYKLTKPFADLDVDDIKAHLFDQAIPANR